MGVEERAAIFRRNRRKHVASNNYAEVINDLGKSRRVLADFKRLATEGSTFRVFKFNPDTDRFAISGGRESNFPTLADIEQGGTAIDGATLLAKLGDATEAIDFGNGHFGVFYESDGLGHIVVRSTDEL
jgi:hypothetical protein